MTETNPAPGKEDNTGPVCWSCGCPETHVFKTRRIGDRIIRHRICDLCGKRIITTEQAGSKKGH